MDNMSSMFLYVKLNWDSNRFLPVESKDCMNSASYEYRDMSARRGAQFVPMGMPKCINQRPGGHLVPPIDPKKHKLIRWRWDLASCQNVLNSIQWFQMRSRKCLGQSEAGRLSCFYDRHLLLCSLIELQRSLFQIQSSPFELESLLIKYRACFLNRELTIYLSFC